MLYKQLSKCQNKSSNNCDHRKKCSRKIQKLKKFGIEPAAVLLFAYVLLTGIGGLFTTLDKLGTASYYNTIELSVLGHYLQLILPVLSVQCI